MKRGITKRDPNTPALRFGSFRIDKGKKEQIVVFVFTFTRDPQV
jgi:hypothetical protein